MPKGPRKFHFLFEKTGLTRFGGLSLFHLFCKSLAVRHFLQLYVRWPDYHHREYHPADLFIAHVLAIVAGIGRIENTQSLIHNGLIPPLLGLTNFPHRDTLRTFLWRFGPQDLRALQIAHDKLRAALFPRLGLLYSAIVDADTTALLTYGHPEGAALGYVPRRRHRQLSYAPILSSEGRSGLSLGAELRSGNVRSSSGTWDFLEPILDKLPSTTASSRTRVRLDGGFYDKAIVESLDQERLTYAIVASMQRPLKTEWSKLDITNLPKDGRLPRLLTLPSNGKKSIVLWRCADLRLWNPRISRGAFLPSRTLYLPPSSGDQSRPHCGNSLAFLLRPGFPRTSFARIQRRLLHGPYSDPKLLGQRHLPGDGPLGLRLGSGFPVPVPATGDSALEYLDSSARVVVASCRVGEARQQQYSVASCKVSRAGNVYENPRRRFENQTDHLTRFANDSANNTRET
jgi:Transposase DDE domain group 1